jgi:hypothetical protein
MSLERFRKIADADQTHRHVAENYADSLYILARKDNAISPLVAIEGLSESVLPVIDGAEINIETGEAQFIPESIEDRPRLLTSFEGSVVFSAQGQGKDRDAKGPSQFGFFAESTESLNGIAVQLNRRPIETKGIFGIRLHANGMRHRQFITENLGDVDSGFRERKGLARIDAKELSSFVGKLNDEVRAEPAVVLREELTPVFSSAQANQLRKEQFWPLTSADIGGPRGGDAHLALATGSWLKYS